MIKWINVNSTAIRKIGYDVKSMQMYIDFEDSNPIYTYCRVPESVFNSFISARSKGQFYHQFIKDKYEC